MRKTRIGEKNFFFFIRESSFCGKPESENFCFFFLCENSRFVENENRRNFFSLFFLSENPPFVENQNRRNFLFFFFFMRQFSFYGKPELENFFFFYPRILVLRKTRIGEIFFCPFFLLMRELSFRGKPESENFFFFFSLSENSRFEENQNRRIFFFFFFFFYAKIFVLWKTKIGEFFFLIRESSF